MNTMVLNDGTVIPTVGFGVFQIPNDGSTYRAVRQALEIGYRHIDTAAAYFNEAEVGQAVRESGIPREEIFVTTAMGPPRQAFRPPWTNWAWGTSTST